MTSKPASIMLVRLFLTQNVMLTSKVEQANLDQHKSSSLIDINDESSQFSKIHFPWNKEVKLVSNFFL